MRSIKNSINLKFENNQVFYKISRLVILAYYLKTK
jgi:hypothetical protein